MRSDRKAFERLYKLIMKEKPQQADAIVWLQGDRYDRVAKVAALYRQGWGKKVIVSGNSILIGNTVRGSHNIPLTENKKSLLRRGVKQSDVILDDDAMNTKDQAIHLITMAKKKKWAAIILVGSSYHQPRIFLTFLKHRKKMHWKGTLINQPAMIAWNRKPAGRDMTARALFQDEFRKIGKYKNDVAPVAAGIHYLTKRT